MGLFDKFKKKPVAPPDFLQIDSMEKAQALAKAGALAPLYLMPLRFGGAQGVENRIFAPAAIVELKDRFDDQVEQLLLQGKVNGYSCRPQYREKSVVPCAIEIAARKDGSDVFTQTIHIW